MADPLHAARAAGSSLASMGRRRLDDLLDVLDLLLERQNGHLTPAQREQIAARASADKASRDSFAAVMVVLLLFLACLTCAALGLCLAIKLGRRPPPLAARMPACSWRCRMSWFMLEPSRYDWLFYIDVL